MDKQALFYAGGKFMRGSFCVLDARLVPLHGVRCRPRTRRPTSPTLRPTYLARRRPNFLAPIPPPTIILLSSIVFSEHLVIPFIFPGRICPCPTHYPSFPTGTPRFPSLPQDLRYSFPFGTTVSLLPRNDFARPLRDHICMLLSNAGSPLGFSAPILHRRIMYKFTYVYLC